MTTTAEQIDEIVDRFLILDSKMDEYTIRSIILSRADMKQALLDIIAAARVEEAEKCLELIDGGKDCICDPILRERIAELEGGEKK